MHLREIIGQEEAKQHVLEAIQQDRLPHALMLTGPEGVGQLAFANAIAQYMNCLNPTPTDSCGHCANCVKIRKGIHPDLRFILPIISKKTGGKQLLSEDYAADFREAFFAAPYLSFAAWQRMLGGENKQLMISVHEIRAMKQQIYLKAFEAPYKVVIVWNAERINVQGANAFLKLLEEPPGKTLLLMTCSDPSKLLTTINSRCQRVALKRIPAEQIQRHLQDARGLEAAEAREIANISEGSIAQAYEYLEESSLALRNRYVDWLRAVYGGRYDQMTETIEELAKESKEHQKLFLTLAVKKMRDSLLYHLGLKHLALLTEEEKAFQENFSKVINPEKVERMTEAMEEGLFHIGRNANAQMVLSALSTRMYAMLRHEG